MNSSECPYGKNWYLEQSETNLSIESLKKFSRQELLEWAKKFRKEVIHAWDELGTPVVGGVTEDKVIEDFRKTATYDVTNFLKMDILTAKADCIENSLAIGGTCNQFFPTLLKTKDIANKSLNGYSIYTHFSEDNMLDRFMRSLQVLLDIDPFNSYSKAITKDEGTARNWLENIEVSNHYDFWLKRVLNPKPNELIITKSEAEQFVEDGLIKQNHIRRNCEHYAIQVFDPRTKIMDFPKVWRLIFDGSPATNFPPLTAKYLYLHFAERMKKPIDEPFIVYDPSSGWGGRILGALACLNERAIHYVGTDPNKDHWMEQLNQTKYEYLAGFFRGNVRTRFAPEYKIFRCGSEEIHEEPEFQKFYEEIDFVFTSPPYFAAEGYSDDPTQSHIKFPQYELWRDHFLKQTLKTASEWLKPGGFLCLNIADVRFDSRVLPLQSDAIEILTQLDMYRLDDLKMVLRDAPAGAKITPSGVPNTRNFCQIIDKKRKFEPILVFQKHYL